jgi:hypothetical protein
VARDRSRRIKQSELMGNVEIGDGFVEQKSLSLVNCPRGLDLRQSPRELNPTLLPARQGCVGLRCERLSIPRRETLLDDPGSLARRGGQCRRSQDARSHEPERVTIPGSPASSPRA